MEKKSVTSTKGRTIPCREYRCVECNANSIVSGKYLNYDYVLASCCSLSCYRKSSPSNTQEGSFELEI